MTIAELLENQNMASVCKRENVLDVDGNVLSFTEVCYQPIIGYAFILSLIVIFWLVARWIWSFLK